MVGSFGSGIQWSRPAELPTQKAAETLTYVTGAPVEIPDEFRVLRTARATCPAGTTPTGGGMTSTGYGFQFAITSSYANGRDWIVTGMNDYALRTGTIQAKVGRIHPVDLREQRLARHRLQPVGRFPAGDRIRSLYRQLGGGLSVGSDQAAVPGTAIPA
ncbi:hypothetical protein OG592_35810 [Streptomyces avidinii]|uniref:hypothetical protein n=1 Tax=Streptomyces avidinii TaxID=1895 RepID=UPI003865AEE3|nr:hypothetical protein OG592_35810 [Streptomyces avidinii]